MVLMASPMQSKKPRQYCFTPQLVKLLQPLQSIKPAASLLILLDQQGSMGPFSLFIDFFLSCLKMVMPNGHIYYFHNVPGQSLYSDPHLGYPHPSEEVLRNYAHNGRVLIISDAGAARGHYSPERLAATQAFLNVARIHTRLVAWLNPAPSCRRAFTTAEDIAELVAMFPLEEGEEMKHAIGVLLGTEPPEQQS